MRSKIISQNIRHETTINMVLSMNRWKGKVAIVTGASAGCGYSIAEQLVDNGVLVVGLARRKEKIEELAKSLEGKPGKLYALKADITKEEDILEAFKWVKANLGPVYILINNAGIARPSNLIDGSTAAWKEVFDTNVLGLTIATREAVKDMRENHVDGHIIHINSVLGHYVAQVPDLNVYPASKFAVTALTETLRQELNLIGSKIKVTSVSPGPVETEFPTDNKLYKSEEYEKFFTAIPKLVGEDVADAVVYVLSTPPHAHVQELMIRPLGENV